MMMKWLPVILGSLCNAAASVMAKTAPPLTLSPPLAVLSNWRLMVAIALYGAAFVLYTMALQRLPLNVAHPVSTAGAIVLVGLCSALLFGEAFSLARIAGYVLLFGGICLLLLSELQTRS